MALKKTFDFQLLLKITKSQKSKLSFYGFIPINHEVMNTLMTPTKSADMMTCFSFFWLLLPDVMRWGKGANMAHVTTSVSLADMKNKFKIINIVLL